MSIGSLVTDAVGNGTVTLTHSITLTLSSDVSETDYILVGIYAGADALPLNGYGAEPMDGPPLLTPSLPENMPINGLFIGQELGETTDNMLILSFFRAGSSLNSGDTVTVQGGVYDVIFNFSGNLNRTLTDEAIIFEDDTYAPMAGAVAVTPVPEPAQWAAFAGLVTLGWLALRRR